MWRASGGKGAGDFFGRRPAARRAFLAGALDAGSAARPPPRPCAPGRGPADRRSPCASRRIRSALRLARRRRPAARGALGQSLRPGQSRDRGPCLQRSFRRDRPDPRRGTLPGRRRIDDRRLSRRAAAPAAPRRSVPREAIEEALGAELAVAQDAGAVIAPGALASHYAPRAKLRLDALSLEAGEAGLDFGGRFSRRPRTCSIYRRRETSTRRRRGCSLFCANSTRADQLHRRRADSACRASARRSTTGCGAPPRRGPVRFERRAGGFASCRIASSSFCAGTPIWASTSRSTPTPHDRTRERAPAPRCRQRAPAQAP